MDEDDAMIRAIRDGTLGGHRVKSDVPAIRSSNITRAVMKTTVLLSDKQWHQKAEIAAIAKIYGTTLETLCIEMGLAESLSGKWIALTDDDVPDVAPDEK